MIKSFLLICVIAVTVGCRVHKPQFKGKSFEESRNYDGTVFTSQGLDSLTNYIESNLETTGMLILKDGKAIYEYGSLDEISYLASCRKSILSMLYGKYVEDGTIDLDESIGEIGIDEDNGLLEIEKTATVNDLVNSRSGVFHKPANKGYDEENILERGSVKPGEYFVYNNWDFNVAGYIFEKKIGKNIYQEIEEQLAIPLGFQDWNIKNQKKLSKKKRSQYPAYHIYISTRDMAKVGQLMLNKGKWNGKQLISQDWIEKITTTVTPTETVNDRYGRNETSPFQFSYGYMFWLVDNFKQHPDFEGAYSAIGAGGQFITVIPKLNIVVAHKCKLSPLASIGLKPGGVSDDVYWEFLFRTLTGKQAISNLLSGSKTVTEIIDFIRNEDIITSKYDISESSINAFGYSYMNTEDYTTALNIFELNIELYPNSFNVYDSYGECLLLLGQKVKGIEAYEKALELDPDNERIKLVLKNNSNE